MTEFYFTAFEDRRPPDPLPYSPLRELLFRFLAVIMLMLGASYIWWRWTASLNVDALWFALPLVIAETCAFIGLLLFVANLWKDAPVVVPVAPVTVNDTRAEPLSEDRPIIVDVFFTTYNEDPEIVRLGLLDAARMDYPHPIDVRIHVLDDGRRDEMRMVALDEGANYLTRSTNVGFKAGNLRNAIEQTTGDFIVICDADTRPFPTMLARCLGHFRDPKVAWVQTPQWFYDLPEGRSLTDWMAAKAGHVGRLLGAVAERVTGGIRLGRDPFVNDPQMFYDVIQRRRNWANAAFCCGAGSIHRREAVMEAALRSYGQAVERQTRETEKATRGLLKERRLDAQLAEAIRTAAASAAEFTPYKFHVSEDIYSSIVLHADRARGWKSVLHPFVESRMLSPQDLVSWTIQRFKYAGGSLDIAANDNPVFRRGLTLPQRIMYASTFWSYLGGIWNLVFLLAPVVYLFTGIAPVSAYSAEFYARFLPFFVMMEVAMAVGTWGIAGYAAKSSYLAFFPVNLRALWTVACGRKISFPVTPKQRQAGRHLSLVWPQIAIILLTLAGIGFAVVSAHLQLAWHSPAGAISNALWGINNILALGGIVLAALWTPENGEDQ